MKEIWKPVVGWEELYAVSNMGRVKSLGRRIRYYRPDWHRYQDRYFPGRILRPGIAKRKYCVLVLIDQDRKLCTHVHRLVMDAFVGPKPPGLETRHLNCNALDNRLSNLAYGTCQDNALDFFRRNKLKRKQKRECYCRAEYTGDGVFVKEIICPLHRRKK